MVVLGHLRVLNALDALAERLKELRGSCFGAVGVISCKETVEGEHSSNHVLINEVNQFSHCFNEDV